MALHSAGILLYRPGDRGPEVLLVHPGGPYHARSDLGAWSVPKGLVEGDEEKLAAAKREFREELGVDVPSTEFFALPEIRQKGGKVVYTWAARGDMDAGTVRSNTFRMEYPYKSGIWREFPEVDRAEWFDFATAREKILPAQAPLISALEGALEAPE
jgi:predicted NUDIX family NTP pyrophosphohydrolase